MTQEICFLLLSAFSFFLDSNYIKIHGRLKGVFVLFPEIGRFVFLHAKKLWFLFLISFFFLFHCDKTCCKRGTGVDNWLRFGQIGMEWFFYEMENGIESGSK